MLLHLCTCSYVSAHAPRHVRKFLRLWICSYTCAHALRDAYMFLLLWICTYTSLNVPPELCTCPPTCAHAPRFVQKPSDLCAFHPTCKHAPEPCTCPRLVHLLLTYAHSLRLVHMPPPPPPPCAHAPSVLDMPPTFAHPLTCEHTYTSRLVHCSQTFAHAPRLLHMLPDL